MDHGGARGRTVLLAAFGSAGSALLAGWILRQGEMPGGARLAVALLPAPFFILFVLAEVRLLGGADEFLRRVVLESLAIAFPIGILGAMTVEFLQRAGFLLEWTIGDVWPFMALVWLPSLAAAWWRYRD